MPEITSRAYISRNNSGLLEEMFRLMEADEPFHTTRKISQILEVPLILANLGNGKPITEYKYKHIEKLRAAYEDMGDKTQTIQRFVMEHIEEDEEVSQAYAFLLEHGPTKLNELVKYATKCSKVPCALVLTTAHSSKGLEFHEVEIAPDLNEKVRDTLFKLVIAKNKNFKGSQDKIIDSLSEELRLYYVAVSRAMISLLNAIHLPNGVVR